MKITYPENIDQAKALMQFLTNEKERHYKDIENIHADMLLLHLKWNVSFVEPNHTFMKVKE